MRQTIHHPASISQRNRGVALLMVLLIILAITILATGFLARADTELACGANMLLRMQMDHVAESGLEHVRGLVLHPQDVPADFWVNGATGQRLVETSRDYYDIRVSQDPSQTTDRCTYEITSEAYRLVEGERIARSGLVATLRLDPCIALEVGTDTTLGNGAKIYGDVYARRHLTNNGVIDGDVFAATYAGAVPTGQLNPQPFSLDWPPVTAGYTNPAYFLSPIDVDSLPASPYLGNRIWRKVGDLEIGGTVNIQGMLMVLGDLTISAGAGASRMIAAPNLPALYVSGNLILENLNGLQIEGLVVVDHDVQISAGAANICITGGLFIGGTLSGPGSTMIVIADPMKAAVVAGATGNQTCWSPATGGFFRSIRRP